MPQAIRSALYYRLHGVRALLARPGVAAGLRVLGWAAFIGWLGFVLLVLALRFVILPGIGDYRTSIEQAVSQTLGQPVRIGRIEAHWRGLNPALALDALELLDAAGEPALSLVRVDAVLSWQSLWRLRPTLGLLAIDRPVLNIRRDLQGRIQVAGMLAQGSDDSAFLDWLLAQEHVRIIDATIVWEDALRDAPPLILEDLQFGLDNRGRRHRFGLSAVPPAELAARIDLRGEVFGDLNQALADFSGKLYLEFTDADLAGWKAWVDYPLDLPRGRGALRIWGDQDDGVSRLVSDVALASVSIRLGRDLPFLELASLRGRFVGQHQAGEWGLSGRQVELLTADGIRMVPTDFKVAGHLQGPAVNGNVAANLIDLGVLARLAEYLPLDARSRQLLHAHAPQGRIADLRASWRFEGERLQRYALDARFDALGVQPAGYFPGASGLSGRVDLTEKGGRLQLDSAPAGVSLPAVFPEADIVFDRLQAQLSWQNTPAAVDVKIEQLAFSSPDIEGKAQGSYRYTGEGPGEIDLQSSFVRADGTAVWRYMPHAVNVTARDWLKRGIVQGKAHDGRFVLKGNLRDFPFRDPSTGTFYVKARASETQIDYAAGWPVIEAIEGDMHFDYGMRIDARQGRILGAELSGVSVIIPDFDVDDEILQVKGNARGATQHFLDFIERSPVAASIDHFTEGMKARGDGRLDLALEIPLSRPEQTRLQGSYHFTDNQLNLLEGLPAIMQVNGRLDMTESSVNAQGIAGRALGGALKVNVANAGGKVRVMATGQANMGEVSRHFGWPLINHLSGNTAWQAEIDIQKRNADVLIRSDLLGVSSPLPDAFNKTAGARLPLRIERKVPAEGQEVYRVQLGEVASGLILRRDGRWTQGVIAVGTADMSLPEKGLAVRVSAPSLDLDTWRNYLPAMEKTADVSDAGAGVEDGLGLGQISLNTQRLRLFGRDFNQVALGLQPANDGWRIGVLSREAVGELFWRGADKGLLEGRFKHLHLTASTLATEGTKSVIDQLPALRLAVDELKLGEKALGQLALNARNQRGAWLLERLQLRNPDGELTGSGRWQHGQPETTQLDFNLAVGNIGGLLGRLGYDDAVRRGKANLQGQLTWAGSPVNLDYATLAGSMQIRAENGQFNKLEPGVGRLLGLISLQSLPRRLSLDFRDLFSEGLAFDSIEGKVALAGGIMRTVDALNINGPAVQVVINGQTDLQKETQDLQVVVRPEVGGLAAVGTAALINPVAGAAALVASKVLQNPLNRLFSYRYQVTGTWDDPDVVKQGVLEELLPGREEKKP